MPAVLYPQQGPLPPLPRSFPARTRGLTLSNPPMSSQGQTQQGRQARPTSRAQPGWLMVITVC